MIKVSVFVRFQLEGALLCNADVICLGLGQARHHTAKAFDHQLGHFFVQFFGQYFDADGLALIFILLCPALLELVHLRQHLIGEGTIHNARGVTHGVAQIH